VRSLSAAVAVVRAVAFHPTLWPVALRQWRRTVPAGWWRHRPFLPVPAPAYVEFRLLTQYGSNTRAPSSADVLNYLVWCRQMR
jgi:hypothetical protein